MRLLYSPHIMEMKTKMDSSRRLYLGLRPRLLLVLSLMFITPAWAVGPKVEFEMQQDAIALRHDRLSLPVSLKCPGFTIDGKTFGLGLAPLSVKGRLPENIVEVTYPPIPCGGADQFEVKLFLQWSTKDSILRKWAEYRLTGVTGSPLLSEIMLEKMDTTGRAVKMNPWGQQSYPVFMKGFFLGIEFPYASTRLENKTLTLGHSPGLRLKAGEWHVSRKAVYGVTLPGEEEREFKRYIAAHHSPSHGIHIDYNSWWTSTAPAYTESEILALMKAFDENLYQPYGVSFDTFTIDLGWSNPKSIWEINPKSFPQGFTPLELAAAKMKSRLGVWLSPSGNYPQAIDEKWAKSQGYETFNLPSWYPGIFTCIAGERYRSRFEARLLDMVKRYGVREFKFDGCQIECTSNEHGHEPGPLSCEAIADAVAKTYAAVHKADPQVWLQACAWNYNPSPWWLFHVDSVLGSHGADLCFGRAPSPVYRESMTSSRDFYSLQGAALSPVPSAYQERFAFIHQTDEDFMNDAVTAMMRGSEFLAMYVNPSYMNDLRWRNLASVIKWARANPLLLQEAEPLLPATWVKEGVPVFTSDAVMPREPYGYAHWQGEEGLVLIRNPWIAPSTYALKLDRAIGTPAGVKELSAVSLYPEIRLYGKGLKAGDTLNVPLAPYETILLSLRSGHSLKNVPSVTERIGGQIRIGSKSSEVRRIDPQFTVTLGTQSAATIGRNLYATYEIKADEEAAAKTAMAIFWTDRLGQNQYATRIKLEADLFTTGTQAQLCILLEGGKVPPKYAYQMKVNGRGFNLEARPSMTNSHVYNQGTLGSPERHWVFLVGRLPQDATSRLETGNNKLSLELIAGDNTTRVAAWVWATKPGRSLTVSDYPNALPSPEMLSVDGATLMEPVTLEALPASMAKK